MTSGDEMNDTPLRMNDADREVLIKIAEQVETISLVLRNQQHAEMGLRARPSGLLLTAKDIGNLDGHVLQNQRISVPPLPDSRRVRRIIRQRQMRARFFADDLFADPAWDILLDLAAARVEGVRVSVTSLCIASGVPPTTALRWISEMVERGLLVRHDDDLDRRRAFIALSDKSALAMARYFSEAGRSLDGI